MSSYERSECHVFGIIGKLFENVREWNIFHAGILKPVIRVIQILNLKIDIIISVRFVCIFPFS